MINSLTVFFRQYTIVAKLLIKHDNPFSEVDSSNLWSALVTKYCFSSFW